MLYAHWYMVLFSLLEDKFKKPNQTVTKEKREIPWFFESQLPLEGEGALSMAKAAMALRQCMTSVQR